MTIDKIERSALNGDELPDGLCAPEQSAFISFRILYREYHAGNIDREQAHREKLRILKEFDDFNSLRNMFLDSIKRWNQAERYMPEVEKAETDCPGGMAECCTPLSTAKKIIRILDGRNK